MNQKACSHYFEILHGRVWGKQFEVLVAGAWKVFWAARQSQGAGFAPCCSQYITLKIILKIIKHFPNVTFLWKQLMYLPLRYCTAVFSCPFSLRTVHSTTSVLGFDQGTNVFIPAHLLEAYYTERGVGKEKIKKFSLGFCLASVILRARSKIRSPMTGGLQGTQPSWGFHFYHGSWRLENLPWMDGIVWCQWYAINTMMTLLGSQQYSCLKLLEKNSHSTMFNFQLHKSFSFLR